MQPLTRAEIAALIPHAGAMCLLDTVIAWDDNRIDCRSATHRRADHPLRHRGRLAAVHLVEYGAQAMAVHGGLLVRRDSAPMLQQGRLAGLRNVDFSRAAPADLARVESALEIVACCELAGAAGLIYRFEVSGDGALLVSGRLTIAGHSSADGPV